jgi:hypothetical protein
MGGHAHLIFRDLQDSHAPLRRVKPVLDGLVSMEVAETLGSELWDLSMLSDDVLHQMNTSACVIILTPTLSVSISVAIALTFITTDILSQLIGASIHFAPLKCRHSMDTYLSV